MSKLTILIPAAGCGRRMRSFGPKALIKLENETVISRQIRLLRKSFPAADFVVVAGFQADRFKRQLPKDVKIVVNHDFETTNVAGSIYRGLQHVRATASTLLVYGDLVFNEKLLEAIDTLQSCLILDPRSVRSDEVGANVVDGKVACLSFGLPMKWAQIALLRPEEAASFRTICAEPLRQRQFGFEILNEIIERGGKFAARIAHPAASLVEIDVSKDIAHARSVA